MVQYSGRTTHELLSCENILQVGQSETQYLSTQPTRASFSWLLAVPFVITFCDSAFSYFMRPLGVTVTANVLIPLVLVYLGLFVGSSILWISRTYVIWLGALVLGLSMAAATADYVSSHRILEASGCAAAFYSGYIFWRQCSEEKRLTLILITLSLLYIAICIVALLKIDPAHFPITVNYWNMDGVGQARPRVTADANMQFYYMFPAALALVLPLQFFRTSTALIAAIGALYVLVMLQTRSGIIVFGLVLLMTLVAPAWERDLGRKKAIIISAIGILIVVVAWPVIERFAAALIYRFQDSTMMSGNGRVGSTMYFFEHLLDPYWWLPRGPEDFVKRFGGLPHSNLTGIFLDGGLLGLMAWLMLVLRPLCKMTILFLLNRLDPVGVMALIGGIAVVALQLTLNNTTMDQIWLWAGALAGALDRHRISG